LSEQDAISKIRAGADVVQIYTGLIYEGPGLPSRAARAIKAMA
jgi:dihydroorotate dehydrogenase